MNTPEFAGWYAYTRWVENLDTAQGWAQENMPSILNKLAEYLPEWEKSAEKPKLEPEDGQEGLYQAAAAD